MEIQTIIIVAAVIQLVVIIAILGIAINVSKIKHTLYIPSGQSYYERAEMEQELGNKTEATDNYKRALYRFNHGDKYHNISGDNKTKWAKETAQQAIDSSSTK